MKKTILILVVAAILVVLGSYALSTKAPSLGSTDYNRIESGVTNTSVSVLSTATTILATSTGRQYARITNDSANVVYLFLGLNATTSKGIRLAPIGVTTSSGPTYYDINSENLYTGVVTGIAAVTSTVTVVEK